MRFYYTELRDVRVIAVPDIGISGLGESKFSDIIPLRWQAIFRFLRARTGSLSPSWKNLMPLMRRKEIERSLARSSCYARGGACRGTDLCCNPPHTFKRVRYLAKEGRGGGEGREIRN